MSPVLLDAKNHIKKCSGRQLQTSIWQVMSCALTEGNGGLSSYKVHLKLAQWLTLSIYSSSLWFICLFFHLLSTLTGVFDQPARKPHCLALFDPSGASGICSELDNDDRSSPKSKLFALYIFFFLRTGKGCSGAESCVIRNGWGWRCSKS